MMRALARTTGDRHVCWSALELGLASSVWVGCALHAEGSDLETRRDELAVTGPWRIPPEVRAAGDAAEVAYVGGGSWDGEGSCSGHLTEHAVALRELLLWAFPQIAFISDYACRPIGVSGTRTSVHGVGRALDLHSPTVAGGEADNDSGDPVGNWLVENAAVLGVQYVIWDGWQWRSNLEPGAKDGPYGGSNPHRDHLHVEVTTSPPDSPAAEPGPDLAVAGETCLALPVEGGLLDESGPCVERHGPDEFWRVDESAGHAGSLYWTNAFTSDTPSNWARYTLSFEAAGDYLVRAHVPSGYGCFHAVRYEVRHAEGLAAVTVDQSASAGWVPVGTYFFTAGEAQWVDVFDDTLEEVVAERHVVVDALHVARATPSFPTVSADAPASPERPPSTVLTSAMRPEESPLAAGAPAAAPPGVAGSASTEATESAGSSRERAACSVSVGRFPGSAEALGQGLLLAWLLRLTRRRCRQRWPQSGAE